MAESCRECSSTEFVNVNVLMSEENWEDGGPIYAFLVSI